MASQSDLVRIVTALEPLAVIKGVPAVAAAVWMARNGRSKHDMCGYIESRYDYDLPYVTLSGK